MPNYPSSLINGLSPGNRLVNNVTDQRDFKFILEPSAGSQAGLAISLASFQTLPNSAVAIGITSFVCGAVGTTLNIDGIGLTSLAYSHTVLVKNQGAGGVGASNGIYTLTTVGAAGVSWVLTRDTRFDEDAEFKLDTIFSIGLGTTNANTKWYLNTAEPITVGTTALTFTQVPTTIDYNSAANYPTDVNVGIDRLNLASDFVNDFKSMINLTQKDLTDLETEIGGLDSVVGIKYLGASNIYTIQHVHRRLEKLNFQIKKLKDDIALMNDTTYFSALYYTSVSGTNAAIGVTGKYPSSKNRLTNSAGGI